MQQEAQQIAQQEITRAKETLKKEAVTLAFHLAQDLIKNNINAADQQKMTEHYLNVLQKETA